jgi:hypothetical protein
MTSDKSASDLQRRSGLPFYEGVVLRREADTRLQAAIFSRSSFFSDDSSKPEFFLSGVAPYSKRLAKRCPQSSMIGLENCFSQTHMGPKPAQTR